MLQLLLLLLAPLLIVVRADLSVIFHETGFSFSYNFAEQVDERDDDNVTTCVREGNFNFTYLDMANPSQLSKQSFAECVRLCVGEHPERTHLLIGFYDAAIFGDEYKCLCADEEAFEKAPKLSDQMCDRKCPFSNYYCGDPTDNILSVYCLRRSCLPLHQRLTPVCATRRPHDAHGCVRTDEIDWAHAHNVRNFSAEVNDHTACVWECHDYHPHSMYSLTRRVGDVLTCSCGYPRTLEPMHMLQSEFCDMLPKTAPFYTVNCISDLDEDGGETYSVDPSSQCSQVLPVGCIFEELLNGTNPSVVVGGEKEPDAQVCHTVCSALSAHTTKHVGVRWNEANSQMICYCLKPDAWNSSLVGPWAACDRSCQPFGAGLMCGGPAQPSFSRPPALSIYCLHEGTESTEQTNEGEETWLELKGTEPLLREILQATANTSITADMMVALLTLLCIILLTMVTYLCFSRGISSLSRHVM